MDDTQKTEAFWDWFEEERRRRRLSMRTVETAGGPYTGWFRKRAISRTPPSFDTCRTIAAAFGLPVEAVLQRADLLPTTEGRPELDRLWVMVKGLTGEHLALVTQVAEALALAEGLRDEEKHFRALEARPGPPRAEDFRERWLALSPDEREEVVREWLAARGDDAGSLHVD